MGIQPDPPGWKALCEARFAQHGRQCWRCGKPATEIDHVLAVVLGRHKRPGQPSAELQVMQLPIRRDRRQPAARPAATRQDPTPEDAAAMDTQPGLVTIKPL
jgi:hypothetical protein